MGVVCGPDSRCFMSEIMKTETPLHRQVHPQFFRNGRVMSPAFRPTRKDAGRLSVDDGSQISAEAAWKRHTTARNLSSVGVLSVTVNECQGERLSVVPEPEPDAPEHVVIDFNKLTKNQTVAVARRLKEKAVERGWQYGPVAE